MFYYSPELKRSRKAFILQAAFEWLIAILIQGTFLAELTGKDGLGFTDAQIGVLNSVISLGCLFQILGSFFRRGSVKKFSIIVSIINQVLFMLLYVIPDVPLSAGVKRTVFVVFIVLAYAGLYIGNPKIAYWRLSLVEPNMRGRYNAWMQIVSLILGTVFSYAMGWMIDYYRAAGQLQTAFRISAVSIFLLMIIHTVTLLLIVDKESEEETEKINVFKNLFGLMKNKTVIKLAVLFVGWNVMQYSAMPFYSTYQLVDFGMDQRTVQILFALVGGVAQIVVALPLGWFADKFSFSKMLMICFVSTLLRSLTIVIATPETSNGVVLFALQYIFNAASSVGVIGALLNIINEAVPQRDTVDTYALCQALGGIVGFFTTVVMSYLVSSIQANNNVFFGVHAYAQQVVSLISALLTVAAMAYLYFAFIKKEDKASKNI